MMTRITRLVVPVAIVGAIACVTSCTTPTRFDRMPDDELAKRQDILLTQLLAVENWTPPGHVKELDLSNPTHRKRQRDLHLRKITMEWELGEVTDELNSRGTANQPNGE